MLHNLGTEHARRKAMKRWLTIVLVIAVVAGGLGYIFWRPVRSVLSSGEEATALTLGEALTTMRVTRGDITRFMTATGNLQPGRQVDLRFSVSGRVEEVLVTVGDRVTEGTPLVRLDNRQQELQYEQALTHYEIAVIDAAPNVVKEREFERDMAYESLQQTILRAPFAGLVTEVYVEPGQSVGTSDVVVQLIDDSVYKVEVAIDELDIGQVQPGQRAIIQLDADRSRPRTGVVERIGYVANVQQGIVTVPVTVQLDDVDPFLRPGYTATVQIAVAEARDVVRIPVEAVNTASGMSMVTKVVDGEPVSVPVQTGVSDGIWIEVVAGLDEGDEIVGLNYRSRGLPSAEQVQEFLRNRAGGMPAGVRGLPGSGGVAMPALPGRLIR